MYKKIKELFLNHIEIFIFTILNLCFYGNFMIKHYAHQYIMNDMKELLGKVIIH